MNMNEIILTVLLNVLWPLTKWFISPLRIEVLCFKYDMRNIEGGGFPVITPYPQRYYAELAVTNRTGHVVYIKKIVLTIDGNESYRRESTERPMRLDPHEYKETGAIFPLSEKDTPILEGRFSIDFIPASGKKKRVRAHFPLSR